MKFFFPDSLDTVDPGYDFATDRHAPHRVGHRTDVFAHEYLGYAPYDGILLSKALVEGYNDMQRFRLGRRLRLLREGVHRFYERGTPLAFMGDCGAYAYVTEDSPPFSVEEVLEFYLTCGFDHILSVDHVVPGFIRPDKSAADVPAEWRRRQKLTLALAEEFLRTARAWGVRAKPIGTAQGWDPSSYAEAVRRLEQMGYDYIALGGLASLQTVDIMATIDAVQRTASSSTRLHLLGVSRPDTFTQLRRWGIASFDSTMPLRQAFKDDKHNYHTAETGYVALRVPQVTGNYRVGKRIRQGVFTTAEAFQLEQRALETLVHFDKGQATLDEAVDAVHAYEVRFNGKDHRTAYRRLLTDRPWKACPCRACRELGIHVAIFRGRERNKRRGYHNLYIFHRKLRAIFPSAPPSSFPTILETP
jgi:hypothetical protein